MFCPNCGVSNDSTANFCGKCGHSLGNQVGNQNNSFQAREEQPVNPYSDDESAHPFEQSNSQSYQQSKDGSFQEQSHQQFQRPTHGQFEQPSENQFQHTGNQQFQQPSNSQFHQQGNQHFQQPNNPQRYSQNPPKKNMKVWIISGVAALIIVILAVSYGLFTFFNNQNNANQNNSNNVGQIVKGSTNQEKNNDEKEIVVEDDDKNGKDSKEEKEKEVVEEKEKTQIIKESLPKVFTIITQDGHGSGFLYADGGYIVTNAHVVAGFSDVLVRNSAGQESPGKVIGISDSLDIALVYSEDYESTQPLPVGNKTPDLGSEVIAIGSPQGFENSASIGYLTGIGREMPLEGYNFVYEELYQIDAQIDQGSSGGPLFDAKTGEVIGINSLIYSNYQEFAFAIPLYTVSDYFNDWIENPMSASDVTAVDIYVGYETDPEEDLGEDYSEFWEWYEQQYGEGSDEYVDYDDYLNTYGYYFDEETLTSFISSYFEYYEWSINDGDFYWVQDMIIPDSNAYIELERQIEEYYGSGMTFDYLYTEISGIEIFEEEGYAIVTTYEEYDLYNEAGEYTTYAETAEYYVVIDENGYYQISEMYYYEVQ